MTMAVPATRYPRDLSLPAIAMASEVQGAHQIEAHSHDRTQLISCTKGRLFVQVDGRHWMISADCAVWIPAGVSHSVMAGESAHYLSVFVDAKLAGKIRSQVQCVILPPLVRELMKSAAQINDLQWVSSAQTRLVEVLVDQLHLIEQAQQVVPIPQDRRLQFLITELMQQPYEACSAEAVAQRASMSLRTLERIFKKQTGLSFCLWQQRLRVMHAVELLQQGKQVKLIASELGYESSSAFISMFRRIMGCTPTKYKNS